MKVPGYAALKLSLPFAVDANLGKAELMDEGRQLLLQLPFKPYRSFIEEVCMPSIHHVCRIRNGGSQRNLSGFNFLKMINTIKYRTIQSISSAH